MSVVAKVILSSNVGGDASPNAYVASLLFSIDTNLRIIAAGKLWLFSSVRFTKANINRPTLIAAAKLDTRRPAFSAKAVTRRGGAIEFQPQLQQILDRTDAELVYTLTPELSDLNLKRLTYQQSFLGANFALSGRWRFAVYRETILYYVRVTAIGNFGTELSLGAGGFRFNADLSAYLGYGGIFGRLGLMVYGEIGLDFKARCTAFINVEFKTKTIKCKWKGLKSKCWEDWLVWGERFEKEFFSINLRIYGGIAFEAKPNSGSIDSGVKAKIAFDQHICGHRLSIAPSFELRGDVIERVKVRVRSFEADLDRAAAKIGDPQTALLTRSLHKNLALSIPETSSERWFVFEKTFRSGKRWVLIPSIDTPWLTPYYQDVDPNDDPTTYDEIAEYRFEQHVEEISVEGMAAPIRPAWCHQNHWGAPTVADRLEEVADVPAIADPDQRNAYERLYRLNMMMLETAELESMASRCPAIRQITSLAFVDDPRVRTTSDEYLRDEDRIDARPGIYPFTFRPRTAPDFEDLEAAISRDQAGGVLGVTRQSEQLRARTTLVGQMLDELGQEKGFFTLQSGELQETGPNFDSYIREEDIDFHSNPEVTISRGGVESTATLVVVDDSRRQSVVDAIKPLPIRQEFVESEEQETGTGKVIVKLPVDWRDLFDLDDDGFIQDATKFELLSHFRIYRRLQAVQDFELIADQVPAPIVTSQERGKVLARPYLSTDVLETRRGKLVNQDILVDQLEAEYRIVPVLIGDDAEPDVIGSSSGTLQAKPFTPTDVFVPTGSALPSGLSMLVPATNLLIADVSTSAKTISKLEFRLFLPSNSNDSTESNASVSPLPKDFHLFFDTVGIPQSGYFGDSVTLQASEDRDELDASDPSQEDGRAVRADRQGNRERFFSPTGRKRVQYSPVFDSEGRVIPNRYEIATDQLDPQSILTGRGYRFFVRDATAGESGLLTELPIFLARESLSDDPRQSRGEQQLEWFQESKLTAEAVMENEFQTSKQIASVDDPRHRTVVAWQAQSEGGVDIEVIDSDTDELLLQQQTETLAESTFRAHQRDFAEPTRWQLVGTSARAANPVTTSSGSSLEQYYWDEHRWFCESPMRGRKGDTSFEAFVKLKDMLRLFAAGANNASYCELADAIQVWSQQTARFRGDVQNDDRTELTQATDRMEAGLRLMYAGLSVPSTERNDDRFVDLQLGYAAHRKAVLGADELDTRFQTPAERETHARDVSTARIFLRVVEARLEQADAALDVTLNVPDIITLSDQMRLKNYLQQHHLDASTITFDKVAQSCDSLPYASDLVDAMKEFVFAGEDPRDEAKYPLTSTFYRWMVDLDISPDRPPEPDDFDNWSQGRRGAQQLLGAVAIVRGGELSDPVNTDGAADTLMGQSVLETSLGRSAGELDRFRHEAILPSQGVAAYVRKAPYTVGLQSIVGQEIGPNQKLKLLLRAHHSIRFERARISQESTEREPIEQSFLPYVPEGLGDSVVASGTGGRLSRGTLVNDDAEFSANDMGRFLTIRYFERTREEGPLSLILEDTYRISSVINSTTLEFVSSDDPPAATELFTWSIREELGPGEHFGTGGVLTGPDGENCMTLTSVGASFVGADAGAQGGEARNITIRAAASPGNNKANCQIKEVLNSETLRFENDQGVAEEFTGDWFIRPTTTSPARTSIRFPIEYFNFLERLGFAVDIVVQNPRTGRLSQSQIVERIEFILNELQEPDLAIDSSYVTIRGEDYFVFVCRGRATDDGSQSGSLVGLSFVKIVTIPRRFIEDMDSVDHGCSTGRMDDVT